MSTFNCPDVAYVLAEVTSGGQKFLLLILCHANEICYTAWLPYSPFIIFIPNSIESKTVAFLSCRLIYECGNIWIELSQTVFRGKAGLTHKCVIQIYAYMHLVEKMTYHCMHFCKMPAD